MRNCSDGALHSKYINQEAIQKYAKENGHRTKEEITIEGPLLATLGIDLGGGRIANVVGQVKTNNKKLVVLDWIQLFYSL